jgi:hypothetical protein
MIDTKGKKIGHINGLSGGKNFVFFFLLKKKKKVLSVGEYAFGKPVKVTSVVGRPSMSGVSKSGITVRKIP